MIRSLVFFIAIFLSPLAKADKPGPFIFKPSSGEGPFPVMVWLHGYRGYSQTGYFPGEPPEAMQAHADVINAVIIGFPATTDLGDGTQQWTEEPVADHAYIQTKLQEIGKSLPIDHNRVALFGFSQGAMVAGDLASLYPDSYLGAILMSPGGMGAPRASETKVPAHAKQVYFCFCGAREHTGNIELTRAYARHMKDVLGATVTLKLYPNVEKHTRPPDFMEKFPEWALAILNQSKPEPKAEEQTKGESSPAPAASKNAKR